MRIEGYTESRDEEASIDSAEENRGMIGTEEMARGREATPVASFWLA